MQMAKNKYISENEKDSLQKIPLELNYTPQSHRQGLATYFRSYLRGFMKDWTDNNLKSDGSKYNLYSDGLKIYTTINSKMQKYAEESVTEHMKNLQKDLPDTHENTSKHVPETSPQNSKTTSQKHQNVI
mgnify:CR=1 FL=1